MLSSLALTQPVFLADVRPDGAFDTKGAVEGTAFWLTGEIFMTAGHVVRAIEASGKCGVLLVTPPGSETPLALRVAETEVLGIDIGLLRVPAAPKLEPGSIHPLKWSAARTVQFDEVWTMGYAYGTHRLGERINYIQRAFKGYIVADPPEYEVRQIGNELFSAFELSFPAPRGLSGSPLLRGGPKLLAEVGVTGIIVGNAETRMLVFQSEERLSEERTTIVEQYESLTTGIAVQSRSILPLHSNLLARSVGEYLRLVGLSAA